MSALGQKLISIVRAKAAENPDFVYYSPASYEDEPPCVYVHNGCASCLIGHALFDAGVIQPSFQDSPKNSMHFTGVEEELSLGLELDEVRWLRQVQRYQDAHRPWADAVRRADEDAENNYGLNRWNVA